MGKQEKRPAPSLATKMGTSLVCGLAVGMALLFARESLVTGGKEAVWQAVNNLFFLDITAQGAESALGIFYLAGQLFIRSLQLIIVPMVSTSITLAIGQISDTRTLGRISAKTLMWFLICSFFALVLACGVGFTNDGAMLAYSLILAINRPIEMLVTALNVVGDAVTSICVARSEGLLDGGKYDK